MRECGVDVLTLAFNAEMAALSAENFISEVLIGRLHGEAFFLGPGHRFGHRALGDAGLLRTSLNSLQSGSSTRVWEIDPVIDETGEIISSSSIRRHLEAGQTAPANRMLGRPYRLRGEVVQGARRGRQLGFPTANLRLEDERKALPAFGVYGGAALFGGRAVSAVGNIGLRPTIAGPKAPSVEVHLLDFSEDLYGQEFEFEVQNYLRPEKAFDSLESLRRQISEDVSLWRKTTSAS
jgi:riboflavin kinase/FMN adenylyltransferase